LFAPALVRGLIAPGFTQPDQIQKTVTLLRILFLCPFFFGLSGLVMGILNSHRRFFFASLAPMFYPLGMIIGIGLLVPRWGIYGLAWGAVLGSILHLSIQLPALFALHSKYRLTLDYTNRYVRNVVRLMAPRLLGQAAVQLNFLVNTILASAQPVGSLSAITWAFSLMMMPEIAVAQAGAIAALPTLSAQASQGQWESMRISLVSVLRVVFFLALPASVGLIVLSRPIVQMVFERGSFDSHSTDMVTWALVFYAAGLVAHSMVEVLVRAYFALQDTYTPAVVSVGGMVLNVALSILLVRVFSNAGWMPHGGLALAVTLATMVEMTILILILRRKMNGWMNRSSWISFGRTCLSSAVLAVVLWLWLQACGSASKWIVGLGGVFIGLTVYGVLNLLLGSPEEKAVIRSVEGRLQPVIRFFRR
jgi:putative peptidoglycan lipid II flippase